MTDAGEEILALAPKLHAERDLPSLLDLLAREAVRLLGADRASLFLLDEDRLELWAPVALGSRKELRFDARLGVAGATALSGRPINVQDTANEARFYPGVDVGTGYKTRTILAVPLRTPAGDVIGAFEVLNKKGKGKAFTAEDERVLEMLARHAATAVANAQIATELESRRKEVRELRRRFSTSSILGTSPRLREIVMLIEEIRDTTVNVLITGESGTGKEKIARAIHEHSPRADKPIVALNCAALPDNLVEAELFGIERGVATGVAERVGKIEQCEGGTLFLDEIGDLSLSSQAKILRALQERVIERVGGRTPIPIDIRLVAATNKDLGAAMRAKEFREDLYYRLKVIHIQTPPLREIPQDIPLLANHFLARACKELNRTPKKLSASVLECFSGYRWPGNVRELENEMVRLAATVRGKTVGVADLSESVRGTAQGEQAWRRGVSLKEAVDDLERRMIGEALAAHRGNRSAAAKSLGLSRQGLLNKMRRHGIETPSGEPV